jgi:hypothetical protein
MVESRPNQPYRIGTTQADAAGMVSPCSGNPDANEDLISTGQTGEAPGRGSRVIE